MAEIRAASAADANRIAEIFVTNYRVNFYPFFHNDAFYFSELNVADTAAEYAAGSDALRHSFVYDDGGIVKGFVRVCGDMIEKLFVEPQFQNGGIGAALLDYAVRTLGGRQLWALQYNTRGIAFYERHGFALTGEQMLEDEWVPLLKMALCNAEP